MPNVKIEYEGPTDPLTFEIDGKAWPGTKTHPDGLGYTGIVRISTDVRVRSLPVVWVEILGGSKLSIPQGAVFVREQMPEQKLAENTLHDIRDILEDRKPPQVKIEELRKLLEERGFK